MSVLLVNANSLSIPLADGCVQTCVTSPPYWGLRDYGVSDQLGLEDTPELYVERMVQVFREVRRVLRDDGTVFLNLGDSYYGSNQGRMADGTQVGGTKQMTNKGSVTIGGGAPRDTTAYHLKPKDLVGIPWRVAFALQADGWYLRSDIIWSKPNPMPESVTDRPTKAHEYVFLLSKSQRYYYDSEAVREESADPVGSAKRYEAPFFVGDKHESGGYSANGQRHTAGMKTFDGGRNRRTVWTIATAPYSGAHFATYPPALVEPCIKAGSRTGDLVLDPFAGSGTTLMVARSLERDAVGLDLSYTYLHEQARTRLEMDKLEAWTNGRKDGAVIHDLPLFQELP
jgi:DNA modification methylase